MTDHAADTPAGPPAPRRAVPDVARPAGAEADVTGLLIAWGAGDGRALDALLPVIYDEMRRQAVRAMRRESAGHTLDATGLVHEVYLRFVAQTRGQWQNRAQFFGVAAQLMRRILVDHARAQHAAKRGGAFQPVTLGHAADVLAMHEALQRLAVLDPAQARLVELRYFGGLTIEETAAVLAVSPATVKREWAVARAWLRQALGVR